MVRQRSRFDRETAVVAQALAQRPLACRSIPGIEKLVAVPGATSMLIRLPAGARCWRSTPHGHNRT